ncbi:hypothetical protein CCM_07898 [Cordyceps militaris CM01]|uniref:Uncharacterized protein n=1 Tax=Cordyceps militaris (strain CM01) TaxID=983644 RepID=G3JP36_CORMM|nr:uncharacterized protein CCM_07898 [Cordyceps militaris CM01]EGX89646.1 hypothetical protein CCM_07898 [Cordyceps militaris CM01]
MRDGSHSSRAASQDLKVVVVKDTNCLCAQHDAGYSCLRNNPARKTALAFITTRDRVSTDEVPALVAWGPDKTAVTLLTADWEVPQDKALSIHPAAGRFRPMLWIRIQGFSHHRGHGKIKPRISGNLWAVDDNPLATGHIRRSLSAFAAVFDDENYRENGSELMCNESRRPPAALPWHTPFDEPSGMVHRLDVRKQGTYTELTLTRSQCFDNYLDIGIALSFVSFDAFQL